MCQPEHNSQFLGTPRSSSWLTSCSVHIQLWTSIQVYDCLWCNGTITSNWLREVASFPVAPTLGTVARGQGQPKSSLTTRSGYFYRLFQARRSLSKHTDGQAYSYYSWNNLKILHVHIGSSENKEYSRNNQKEIWEHSVSTCMHTHPPTASIIPITTTNSISTHTSGIHVSTPLQQPRDCCTRAIQSRDNTQFSIHIAISQYHTLHSSPLNMRSRVSPKAWNLSRALLSLSLCG